MGRDERPSLAAIEARAVVLIECVQLVREPACRSRSPERRSDIAGDLGKANRVEPYVRIGLAPEDVEDTPSRAATASSSAG